MVRTNLTPDIRVTQWHIQLDLFVYLAFTAFTASTLSIIDQIDTFRAFIIHTVVSASAYFSLYSFWRLSARLINRRGKKSLTLLQIMSLGAFGGVIFSTSQSAAAWVFEFPLDFNLSLSLIAYCVSTSFWLPAGSVISNNYRQYLQLKRSIQEEMLQQESVQLARAKALEEYRLRLERQIQESLRVTTNQAAALFKSLKEDEVKELPEQLRVISNEYFRLTAHSLVNQGSVRDSWFSKVRLGAKTLIETIQESVQARPLNPLWYATMVAVTAIPPVLHTQDVFLTFQMIVVIFATSYLVQSIQLWIAKNYNVNLMVLTLVSMLLNIIVSLVAVRSLPTNDPERYYPVGFIILILSINFLGHLAQVGLLRGEDFRIRSFAPIEKLIQDEKGASAAFLEITRNWARYIHGSFTSKLESSALALETALRANDFAEVEKAIIEVGNFLKTEEISQPMPQAVLIDEINERCKNWIGLIEFEIDTNIDRGDDVGVSIHQVGTCIEEAILNASRHGNCNWIGIEIVNTELLFTIIFRDNGGGFTSHKQGFGSQIFNEATNGQWELWRDERRQLTVLHLNFRKIP